MDTPNQHPLANQQKYYVLMMTATVIVCDATSTVDAAQYALLQGPPLIDPRQLSWVVKHVSTVPIELGEIDDAPDSSDATPPDAPSVPVVNEATGRTLRLVKD